MANPMDDVVPLEDLPLAARQALPYGHPLLDAHAAKVNSANGLPEHFLTALKNAGERSESGSKSIRGAAGVMQFMPNTAKEYGLADRTDPLASIDAAGRMGAAMMKKLGTSDPALLAAAYNAGPNRDSLRAGQVPDIPETKAYAKRVSDYIGAQNKPVAHDDLVPLSDLPPDVRAKQNDTTRSATNPNYYSPVSDSAIDNALAGVGKTVVDAGKGLGQLATAPINYASRAINGKNLIDPKLFSTDESDRLDKALMDTKAGFGGNLAGNIGITASPFGVLSKLGTVKNIAQAASKIPAVGGALASMFPSMFAGSALGFAQPTQDDQGFGARVGNAAIGATAGPIGHAMGLAGSALGNMAGKAGSMASKAADYVGLTQPGFSKNLTPSGEAAARAAFEHGVHVYPQQITAPGTALNPAQHAEQSRSFTRAIAKKDLNQDTHDLNAALQNADKQSGVDYRKVYNNETIPIHESIPHLKSLQGAVSESYDPRFKNPKSEAANDLLARAIESAESKPTLTGDEMQKALSMYKGKVREYQAGDKNGFIDRSAIDTIHDITNSLTGASNKVLSPEKQELLKATNGRYRRMLELEPTLQNNALGTLSPTDYANVVQKKYPKEFNFGRGDQSRSDLARYGTTFMTEKAAPQTPVSALRNHVIAPLAGAALGHLIDPKDTTSMPHLGSIGAGALIGSALSGHATPSTTRILAEELARKNGALAAMFRPGNTASSLAQAVNAQAAAEKAQHDIGAAP